jgi:hypothetical protein
MRKLVCAGWLAASVLPAAAVHAEPCRLANLHWLAGVWRSDDATSRSEERWVLGPGDRLMGSSWLLHTDKPGGVIEAETIQEDSGSVTLRLRHFSADLTMARETREAPMVFMASDCSPRSIRFSGQGPHLGETITYRRAGDRLTFIGDFLHREDSSPEVVASSVVIRFVRGR